MKLFVSFLFLLSTFTVCEETAAQVRGPRYNPPGGRGGGHHQGPTRHSPSPNSGNSTGGYAPHGPRYNPNPGNGHGGYNPTPQGPRYNPNPGNGQGGYNPTPQGPRYNPNPGTVISRPHPTNYGTPQYHRPYGYNPIPYSTYYHRPYSNTYVHTQRYYRSYDWYSWVYRSYPNYIYANWIFFPAGGYGNGYWTIDNYPYYVFNGYRYRYSTFDYCNYQLVDQFDHRVAQTYWNQICNIGYDQCSYERDRLNAQNGQYRFFCSETFREFGEDYGTPNTCYDRNQDGRCDDYNRPNNDTCYDVNQDGYCD